jgi:protein-disulfide isomerase
MGSTLGSNLALLSLLWLPLACGRKADVVAAAAPAAGAEQVVAELDGRRITLAELDERVAAQLAPLEQQVYDVRSEGLKELIGEVLLEKEARARGLSVEALLAAEVDAKVGAPTSQQVAQVYEANKARLAGVSQDKAYAQIEEAIRGQSQATRKREFRQELIRKAAIQTNLEPPRVKVEVPKGAPTLGPAEAKVTIVAFIDYQCPYCHRSQEAVEKLMRQYQGKVRLVHQDFPLDIHERAFAASQAAACAGEQGKFWDYHRSLLTAQGSFDSVDLRDRAATLGLDKRAFAACLASGRHDAEIHASLERGQKLGVNSTPTFFINGRRLVGARPYEDFESAVLSEGL